MSDNPATPATPENPPAGAQPSNSGEGVTIPKTRFDEVNERRKAAEAELEKFRQAEAQRKQAELEAKGEYEKILKAKDEELNQLRPAAEKLTKYEASRRETLLAKLPEEHRAIADDLPLDKLEGYAELHTKQAKTPVDSGRPGTAQAGTALTPQEIREGVAKGGAAWLKENAGRLPRG